MIGYLKGIVLDVEDNNVLLDVNNIGFKVAIPMCDLYAANEGESLILHTYLHKREDAIELYGSIDKKEINLFKRLIEVSGIGPKVALGILSKLSVTDLVDAIIDGNVTTLSSCPGLGKKTSERLVLELRDKLIKQGMQTSGQTKVLKIDENDNSVKDECYEALVGLGYKKSDAKSMIEKVYTDGMNIEELIKATLAK